MKNLNRKKKLFQFVFFFLDALLLWVSFNVSHYLWIKSIHSQWALIPEMAVIWGVFLMTGFLASAYDLWSREWQVSIAERFLVSVVPGILISISVTFILPARYEGGLLGRGPFLSGLLIFSVLGYLSRKLIFHFFYHQNSGYRILFISSLKAADDFFSDLQKIPQRIAMTLLYDPAIKKSSRENREMLQKAEACRIVEKAESWNTLSDYNERNFTAVVLGLNTVFPQDIVERLMAMRMRGDAIYDITEFYEMMFQKIPVFHIREGWFILSSGFNILHEPFRIKIKRAFDIFLSVSMLVFSFPFWILAAIAIKLESSGPVFFSQERTGINDRPFVLHKFRSMRKDAEKNGAKWASVNDARVTRIGKIIRATRIDELPQLWNVLKGDMSFIGPRPERPVFIRDLEKQIPYYNLRHLVKPGITGWAQVMYPYGASVEDARQKLEYDLYYIKNFSFVLDMDIVLKTIRIVLFGKGR